MCNWNGNTEYRSNKLLYFFTNVSMQFQIMVIFGADFCTGTFDQVIFGFETKMAAVFMQYISLFPTLKYKLVIVYDKTKTKELGKK